MRNSFLGETEVRVNNSHKFHILMVYYNWSRHPRRHSRQLSIEITQSTRDSKMRPLNILNSGIHGYPCKWLIASLLINLCVSDVNRMACATIFPHIRENWTSSRWIIRNTMSKQVQGGINELSAVIDITVENIGRNNRFLNWRNINVKI